MKVTPIGSQGVTPEVIADTLMKDSKEIQEVFVIAFTKEGHTWRYYSGEISSMLLAAAIVHEDALGKFRTQ